MGAGARGGAGEGEWDGQQRPGSAGEAWGLRRPEAGGVTVRRRGTGEWRRTEHRSEAGGHGKPWAGEPRALAHGKGQRLEAGAAMRGGGGGGMGGGGGGGAGRPGGGGGVGRGRWGGGGGGGGVL